jgi:hypothetical protein
MKIFMNTKIMKIERNVQDVRRQWPGDGSMINLGGLGEMHE